MRGVVLDAKLGYGQVCMYVGEGAMFSEVRSYIFRTHGVVREAHGTKRNNA